MGGHRLGAAGAVPTLGAAEIGQVVASHRHVPITLAAKIACKMELISLLEQQHKCANFYLEHRISPSSPSSGQQTPPVEANPLKETLIKH